MKGAGRDVTLTPLTVQYRHDMTRDYGSQSTKGSDWYISETRHAGGL